MREIFWHNSKGKLDISLGHLPRYHCPHPCPVFFLYLFSPKLSNLLPLDSLVIPDEKKKNEKEYHNTACTSEESNTRLEGRYIVTPFIRKSIHKSLSASTFILSHYPTISLSIHPLCLKYESKVTLYLHCSPIWCVPLLFFFFGV